MLVEIPDSIIKVNNKDFIQNLRINSEYDKSNNVSRMRIKFNKGDNFNVPVDIAVYEIRSSFQSFGYEINIEGCELKNNIDFEVKITTGIFNKDWNISGVINKHKIKLTSDSIYDAFIRLIKLISQKNYLRKGEVK